MHKKLLIPILLLMCHTVLAAAAPDSSKLSPWPKVEGNYLQALKDENGTWYLASAVVKGKKITQAIGLVEEPTDLSSALYQQIPGAEILVRGVECESLMYTLIRDPYNMQKAYWSAAPRGITQISSGCQIKNTPEKWVFIKG